MVGSCPQGTSSPLKTQTLLWKYMQSGVRGEKERSICLGQKGRPPVGIDTRANYGRSGSRMPARKGGERFSKPKEAALRLREDSSGR